jgi:hypothetical protein
MPGKNGKKSSPPEGARRGTQFLVQIRADMTDAEPKEAVAQLRRALAEEREREKGSPAKTKGRRKPSDG